MEKLKINAWRDSQTPLNYAGSDELQKFPTKIEYICQKEWHGITLFVEPALDPQHRHIIDEVKSPFKLLTFHEPRGLHQLSEQRHVWAEEMMDKFDYILTYDEYFLTKYPEKTVFCVDNMTWILDHQTKIYPKSKLISLIYSWKKSTPGHKLRHVIAESATGIHLFGNGSPNPIEWKVDGLADFMYSIVIENNKAKWYFTEKILDAFATGTIPIYFGASNIGDYFDERGIIQFDRIEELPAIFENLSNEDYQSRLPYIKENFNRVKAYHLYEDWMHEHIYSPMLLHEAMKYA